MLIKVVKCLNEQTEEAIKIHQSRRESNMEHYSPLRKKSTGNCHVDKDVTRNLGKLEGNKCIASRTIACHCILHAVQSREPEIPPFKHNGLEKKNDKNLKEIISKLPLFPLLLSVLIPSCPL